MTTPFPRNPAPLAWQLPVFPGWLQNLPHWRSGSAALVTWEGRADAERQPYRPFG